MLHSASTRQAEYTVHFGPCLRPLSAWFPSSLPCPSSFLTPNFSVTQLVTTPFLLFLLPSSSFPVCQLGCSALHRAAGAGQLPLCDLLLEEGADVEATDRSGQTALMVALAAGHDQVGE